jgi:lactate dehydrogenase-like 2-hydroxyacid dehydrogenase
LAPRYETGVMREGLSGDYHLTLTAVALPRGSFGSFGCFGHVARTRANPTDLNALVGWQLTGEILGIYGMGQIGQAVAKRARGFGMKIDHVTVEQWEPEMKPIKRTLLCPPLKRGRGDSF